LLGMDRPLRCLPSRQPSGAGAWTFQYARDGANDQASCIMFASGFGSASGVLGTFVVRASGCSPDLG